MQSLLSDEQMQQQGTMKLQRENAPMLASKEPGSRQPPTLMVMDANQCAQQKESLAQPLKHQVPRNAKCLLVILTLNLLVMLEGPALAGSS